MSTCFIIMPITTPEHLIPIYSDDSDHFIHVLNHLFIPAVEKAKFTPIAPIAKGSDLIQAEIIKNIETSDLILCDISSLNPNVFFELGIRTALNKPVCYVKDDKTPSIPFDNSIVNHYSYDALLVPWTLDDEVDHLSQHISETWGKNNSSNSLWKYFGLSSIGTPIVSKGIVEDRFELLNMKIDSLIKSTDNLAKVNNVEYEQKKRKEIDYELAAINGEIAAIMDLIDDEAAKAANTGEYEEVVQRLKRLQKMKTILLKERSQ